MIIGWGPIVFSESEKCERRNVIDVIGGVGFGSEECVVVIAMNCFVRWIIFIGGQNLTLNQYYSPKIFAQIKKNC